MSSIWAKIGMIVGAIVLLVSLFFIVKWQKDTIDEQKNSIVEMKQLRDDIVRAQSQYVSKQDLENFAKNSDIDLKPIKEDLAKLDADIKGISKVLVSTSGYVGHNLPSTNTIPRPNTGNGGGNSTTVPCPGGEEVECPASDQYGYQANVQVLSINEPIKDKSVPFGEAEFRAWQEKPWDLKILPRNYSLTTVLGEDEEGKHYTYHKFAIETDGKSYPVEIDNAQFVEEKPEASFKFNPRLYLGVDAGVYVHPAPKAEVVPNVQVFMFSYGQTKISSDWTFAGVGLGYASQNKSLGIVITPVDYNVGHDLPLVDNLHVGPSVVIDTTGGVAITGGIKVGL